MPYFSRKEISSKQVSIALFDLYAWSEAASLLYILFTLCFFHKTHSSAECGKMYLPSKSLLLPAQA
jgi:hypothetical protein